MSRGGHRCVRYGMPTVAEEVWGGMSRTRADVIAVTGVTGAVGGAVARALSEGETDNPPTLLVRDASRAPDLPGPVRVCDHADEARCRSALDGVATLFMVSAAEAADRREQHRTMVRAAAAAGVGHVVYTSFAAAAADSTFTLGRDHHDTEQALLASGMQTTILRDSFYLDLLPLFADPAGVLRGPAGQGRVAGVARQDVADVAVAVLRQPGVHQGATYTLTGPQALTLSEVAARAGAVLGRPLRFEDETLEHAYASRRAAYPGAEQWQLDAWVSTYTAIAGGLLAAVTQDVPRLTGHPARTLEDALLGR